MPELPQSQQGVLGVTGLPMWGGLVQNEYLRELEGDRAVHVFREMSEDPIIGGILLAIELLVRRVTFPVVPANLGDSASEADKQKALDTAEFVDQCLGDMRPDWGTTLSQILSMIPYGWSYFETVYKVREGQVLDSRGIPDPFISSKYDDGRIGWRTWAVRGQETRDRWEYDPGTGDTLGMWQLAPPEYKQVYIPIQKALHFRLRAVEGNPEGYSLLRHAYRPWYFRKNIEKVEGIGIERDLAGLPTAWLPPEYMADDADDGKKALYAMVKKIVTQIRRDESEGLVFPLAHDDKGHQLFDFKLMTSGGARQFDTNKIIMRYDQRIAMSFLADFLLLGHESVGSFALASSKTELFARAVGAILDSMCDTININAIPTLIAFNNISPKYIPTLTHGDMSAPDLNELGTFIQRLSLAGFDFTNERAVSQYLLEAAGLPTLSDEGEELDLLPSGYPGTDLRGDPYKIGPDATRVPPPVPVTVVPAEAPAAGGAGAGAGGGGGAQNRRAPTRTRSPETQAKPPAPPAARNAAEPDGVEEEEFAAEVIIEKIPGQTASIIHALLDAGFAAPVITKALRVRPQHVHEVRRRRARARARQDAMSPATMQSVMDAIAGAEPDSEPNFDLDRDL